jgi:hypothetical protein
MRTFKLGQIIAERRFVFQSHAGWSRDVEVKIGLPMPDEAEGRAWVCPYEISGIGDDGVFAIFGVDSMHALDLAVHTIPAELGAFARRSGGKFLYAGHPDTTLLRGCRMALEYVGDIFPPSDGVRTRVGLATS